jgi:Domain of unknown function (DUF1824)
MLTIPAAEQLLWDLKDLEHTATPEQCAQLRTALQALTAVADYHIFGVCAEQQLAGLKALQSYAQHFGYELTEKMGQELPTLAGAVYLKFNPRSQRLYVDTYNGTYRGVLVSFQSDLAEGYGGTHGHFPLDLFAG